MASYTENSFTGITLEDYILYRRKAYNDFDIATLVVKQKSWEKAVKEFNKIAEPYDAVLGLQEGITDISDFVLGTNIGKAPYMIRGTGVKEKRK